MFKHISQSYAEYMEKKLPEAIERAIYDSDCKRRRGESMLQYTIRRDKLFKRLEKEGWTVPWDAKSLKPVWGVGGLGARGRVRGWAARWGLDGWPVMLVTFLFHPVFSRPGRLQLAFSLAPCNRFFKLQFKIIHMAIVFPNDLQ